MVAHEQMATESDEGRLTDRSEPLGIDRRTLLRAGVAAVAVGLPVATLAACGSSSGGSNIGGGSGGSNNGGASSSPGGGGSGVSAKVADVPVGGGVIVKSGSEEAVICQPSSGSFKAYSGRCTHQNCLVTSVSDGTISCPCHGSQYNIADGSVKRGPARRSLKELTATVNGDTVSVTGL